MPDEEAWAFCRALRPRLVSALALYCGDRWLAEELAQDTLVRVLERWATVSRTDSPSTWAHRIAFNAADSWFRRRAAERRAVRRFAARRGEEPSDLLDPQVLAVRQAVAALPPRQRQVVVLHFVADLSVQETARTMRCAAGTVKSLTHLALRSLRESTALRFDEDAEVDHA